MRKIAALGATALLGAGLVAGATPAQAQVGCSPILYPVCSAVFRQIEHVEEELDRVPGYIQYVEDTAYLLYDFADRTVRCEVFGECG